jgi:hypothetical protein
MTVPSCRSTRDVRRSRRSNRRHGTRSSTRCRRRIAGDWVCGPREIRRSWGGVRSGGQGAFEASGSPVAYGLSGRDWQRWLMGDAVGREDRRAVGELGFVAGGRLVRAPSTPHPAPWLWRKRGTRRRAGRGPLSFSRRHQGHDVVAPSVRKRLAGGRLPQPLSDLGVPSGGPFPCDRRAYASLTKRHASRQST